MSITGDEVICEVDRREIELLLYKKSFNRKERLISPVPNLSVGCKTQVRKDKYAHKDMSIAFHMEKFHL